jgi:hypothetical protein
MKFKVGDKVRVMFNTIGSKFKPDEEAVVLKCLPDDLEYNVRGEEDSWFISESSLELIEEPIIFNKEAVKAIKEKCYSIKDIRLEKLKQLIKAVNTLGEFGKQVELKITIELDGKKIEL